MDKFGTAVILAGGKSSRMGFDKQLLKIKERRLMDNIIGKLKQEFEEIIIVTNKPEYYLGLSHKITRDIISQKGPLSGIHAGLTMASSEMVYFTACDMPNINLDYIRLMKSNLNKEDVKACVTRFGPWIEPFNSFYSKHMIDDIKEHLDRNQRSIFSLLKKTNTLYIEEEIAREYSPDWNMFLNLNTKEDLDSFLNKADK